MSVLPFNLILFQHSLQRHVGSLELSLDNTVVSSFRDHGRLRLASHDKRKRTKQNRFSGSGLARNNDQTLRKINLQRVYQYVIPYLKPVEHRLLLVLLSHSVEDVAFLELLDSYEAWLWLLLVIF